MKNIEVVTKITKIENDLDELQLTASNVTISDTNGIFEATNVEDAILENKTSILNLEKLVGQANQTLIEECNKLLDI